MNNHFRKMQEVITLRGNVITEWWYELLTQHVSDDYVMIRRFLDVTERKFPYYVSSSSAPMVVGGFPL
jgi:hypothetical protein